MRLRISYIIALAGFMSVFKLHVAMDGRTAITQSLELKELLMCDFNAYAIQFKFKECDRAAQCSCVSRILRISLKKNLI